ncbi:N-acyl-D-amino-acid deacylase family protein [Mycolicibacterium brisbanense]|uniref:N-acyl-D-amino-acid deacylase family protein n=1 Tax=Mycolicibacterium brisbanense TaxID=146020 RepID=UPI00079FD9DD|nr:D-aminoacylase [Mycolicibacterium brisbanense]MCV7160893.1 D-aminoacylase [Mycolicibacterium brisbanense]
MPSSPTLLIHSGLIVDGTGNPGYRAAVYVRDGHMRIVRGSTEHIKADRTIDASGLTIAPGFIDIHSHSDLLLLDTPNPDFKIRQGVTTEILGVDGLSYAPFNDLDSLKSFVAQNAGIGGYPGIEYTWRTVGEYLDRFDRRSVVNVGTFVGNTALRVSAVGWGNQPASRREIRNMQAILRSAMHDGALGMSTGLDYPPGCHADTQELIELARVVTEMGGVYHTHVRYRKGDQYLDPFIEALQIGRESGVPVHITHFSRVARPDGGGAKGLLDLIDNARAEGIDVTFDSYPYQWGGSRLALLLPEWIQRDGYSATCSRLHDPDVRLRLAAELDEGATAQYDVSKPYSDIRIGGLTATGHTAFEGRYLSEIVAALGVSPAEAICDLVAENPTASFTRTSADPMTLWRFVCHPLGMIASDAVTTALAPSPRVYGSFPRVLGDFVREENLLTLPEAIRKMTSYPAQRLGLTGRGLIADGMIADITVFDAQTVRAPATYERPRLLAEGVKYVIVSGSIVLDDTEMTSNTPGRKVGTTFL